ncbi:MAG: lamin tail domain-containing protein [Saprospiraceae bacterium]|nr:lamin tail domain-containing protein [Saprospiraceae bacterium]
MKKNLLSFVALTLFSINALFSQTSACSELFISEYVEGYGNNRALELYNPTSAAIDLSLYSVGRFNNGSTQLVGIQIPSGYSIQPYSTFVIVLDKRDAAGTGLETPIWNGYQSVAACIDSVTMMPIIDPVSGDTVQCIQYDATGSPIIGTVYTDWLDLQGKADVFLCPVYATNNAMYFNGNDAVALIKGAEVLPDGSNIIDVIGVIGTDPGESWLTSTGQFLTKDRTLVRKADIQGGTGIVAAVLQDTFEYNQWLSYGKNTFSKLGWHTCNCDPSGNQEINTIDVMIAPNPTSSIIQYAAEKQVKYISVYNTIGQIVYRSNNAINQNYGSIDVSEITNGMYFMLLEFDGNQKTIRQFIKE